MFGRTTLDAVLTALQEIRQARRAFSPGDDHVHRSRRQARDDRSRNPRGGFPGRRARRRLRFCGDAGHGGCHRILYRLRARRGWVRCSRRLPKATFSSPSAARRSSARRHPAKRRCMMHDYLTTRGLRERLRDHAHPPARGSHCLRHPRPRARCSPRSRNGRSPSSPTEK